MGEHTLGEQLILFSEPEVVIQDGEDTQICRLCLRELPLSYFLIKSYIKTKINNKTVGYLDTNCKSCHQKYKQEAHVRRRNLKLPNKNYRCPICRRDEEEIKNNIILVEEKTLRRCIKNSTIWVVDHDHTTEKFRGFLCQKCNIGLGFLGDSITSLGRAVKYLNGEPIGDEND